MSASLTHLLETKKLTLIVSLPENRLDLARAAIDAGVDVIKLHVNVHHRASGNSFAAVNTYEEVFRKIREEFSGPLGIVPGGEFEDIKRMEMEQLIQLGFNFYSIYAHHKPGWLMQLGGMEKTFAITNEYRFSQLGKVKHLGVSALEASIIPGEEYGTPLTFKDILSYNALVQSVDVPVMVPSQRKIEPSDIPLLYEAGVKAVMLGAVVIGKTEESIKGAISSFRETIDSL
ncbi:hypothetical protein [Neobacillus vireti]|uniref:Thiamine-phosphate pyrophosphorylase n=1 Tax=Neobacillus vireti LMG 21834 TaxID=1131730 RepID=A0AB94IMM7_9BACI|nr:hypothetical protein [Neobacillus vireti]ETI68371.1 hypothetical protein BAVI_12909 [Neobacillus vireti LMG 21834]KLT16323.1 hypothetical protein AA980_17655 [Neobacillus vireti]